MTLENAIENVRASFEMEDLIMTNEDKKRGLAILDGSVSIEQVIDDIKKKYAPMSQV